MKSQDIITKAREELVTFIIFEVKMIYMCIHNHEPYLEDEEGWVIESGDVATNPSVGVEVCNVVGNDSVLGTEYRMVQKYIVKDDTLIIVAGDVCEEFGYTEAEPINLNVHQLTTDELGDIAMTLEETFNSYIKK
jgi:hypothetical protein